LHLRNPVDTLVQLKTSIQEVLRHPQLELDIDFDRTSDLIALYLEELVKWGSKINLTSEKDEQSILTNHIFDSLLYAKAITGTGPILDIGSGAGFPGIPLKIMFPEREFVLVESRRKRTSFLGSTVRKLKLDNIEVLNNRAEELFSNDKYARQFDYVIFRAVSSISDCLKLALPFIKETGKIVIKKEPEASIDSAEIGQLSVKLEKSLPVISFDGQKSDLLVFAKCSTWNIYCWQSITSVVICKKYKFQGSYGQSHQRRQSKGWSGQNHDINKPSCLPGSFWKKNFACGSGSTK
jgi:16S rRNA (guanine(527)-N(7))-methyltransferase RsmG